MHTTSLRHSNPVLFFFFVSEFFHKLCPYLLSPNSASSQAASGYIYIFLLSLIDTVFFAVFLFVLLSFVWVWGQQAGRRGGVYMLGVCERGECGFGIHWLCVVFFFLFFGRSVFCYSGSDLRRGLGSVRDVRFAWIDKL